jgi:hypothetical protein
MLAAVDIVEIFSPEGCLIVYSQMSWSHWSHILQEKHKNSDFTVTL